MTATAIYCTLCRNTNDSANDICTLCRNTNDSTTDICTLCREAIEGDLQTPYRYWQECNQRYRMCCGGISHDRKSFYFHGKGFECEYPERKDRLEGDSSACVEMGVNFNDSGASTYYIIDTDTSTDSSEYGETIPYPKGKGHERFWKAIDKQLDKAAEAAWNADLLTCGVCGYHYYSPNGPCHDEQSEDNNDDE